MVLSAQKKSVSTRDDQSSDTAVSEAETTIPWLFGAFQAAELTRREAGYWQVIFPDYQDDYGLLLYKRGKDNHV